MKSILITGSNGLLGQKLLELLSQEVYQQRYRIVASARGKDRYKGEGYKYISLDITDKIAVDACIETEQPDYVIHTAAMTQVDDCEQNKEQAVLVNTTATEYLLDACKKYGSFFLYVSTDFVFSGEKELLTENEKPAPVNFYGETKYKAEEAVKRYISDWAIVRTVLVYGLVKDMSRSNLLLWVQKSLNEKKAIRVVSDQFRTPTYIDDLAMGCILVIEKEAQGIFHISGKELLTPYEMAVETARYLELDTNLISSTNASEFQEIGMRPPKTGFDISKAEKILEFNPLSFQEGMKKMFKETSMFSKSES